MPTLAEYGDNGVTLIGGDGDDTIFGAAHTDRLYGGSDNDRLIGLDGSDRMYGGAGTDLYIVDHDFNDTNRALMTNEGSRGGSFNNGIFNYIDIISDSDGVGQVRYDNSSPTNSTNGVGVLRLENSDQNSISLEPESIEYRLLDGHYRLLQFGAHADQVNGLDPVWVKRGRLSEDGESWFIFATPRSWVDPVTQTTKSGIVFFEIVQTFTYRAIVAIEGFTDGMLGITLDRFGGGGAPTDGAPTHEGGYHDDALNGTASDDVMIGGGGDDNIVSGAGNDTLVGGFQDDTLAGGAGNDRYVYAANDGIDVITDTGGTADSIKLVKVATSDVTVVGPWSSRGAHDLTLSFADGSRIYVRDHFAASGDNAIEFVIFDDGSIWSASDLRARAVDAASSGVPMFGVTYQGTTGDDNILTPISGPFVIDGGLGNDTINTSAVTQDDTVFGGPGNDQIRAGRGADSIYGEAGDDIIVWDDLDAVIDGGEGNDTLRLSFRYGWNVDLVDQSATAFVPRVFSSRNTTVATQSFVNIESVITARRDDTITGNDEDNVLDARAGNDTIIGAGGDDTLIGGEGNDSLFGGLGADTYVFNVGDGRDTILDGGVGSLGDKVVLHGILPSEVTVIVAADDADDVKLTFADGGSITLDEQLNRLGLDAIERIVFDNGTTWDAAEIARLAGASQTDMSQASAGQPEVTIIAGTMTDESLTGTSAAETITGGQGDDTLSGGGGSDIYRYASGDGSDIIDEGQTTGTDRLLFTNLNIADLTFTRKISNTYDLGITINATGHTITVDDQFDSANEGIEQIEFADGTVWDRAMIKSHAWLRGTTDDDTITGTADDEIIIGNSGDDTLRGSSGNDTYRYASGDGSDIIDESTAAGTDTLLFTNLNIADLTVSRKISNTNDLGITTSATSHTITVDDQFRLANEGLERIQFADGTVWDRATIASHAWLRGTTGNDTIRGTADDDIIVGNGGDDTLSGSSGSDTYRYASGDGSDFIDESRDTGTDTLLFTNLNIADLTFTRKISNTKDLEVKVNATGQTITVDDHFRLANEGLERIESADGTVWDRATIASHAWLRGTTGDDMIAGTADDDTIRGGAGDDTLRGSGGDDIYRYASGDGSDIIDESLDTGTDTLLFTDLNIADLTFSRKISNTDDLGIIVNATGQTITVDDHFRLANEGLETIQFADGTMWDRARILSEAWFRGTTGDDTITASAGADRIDGGAGDDRLDGGEGDDRLIGGAGDDVLSGGSGDDLFVFRAGFGRDTITDFSAGEDSDDVIEFDSITGASTYAQVLARAADDGTHTTITIDADNSIVLQNVVVADLGADDFRFA